MRNFVSCLTGGVLVLLALALIVPPVGLSSSIAAVSPAEQALPVQSVDRTNKADRIPTSSQEGKQPEKPRPVLVGCDPVFSPLSASAQANFAGRCVA
jgi:hypothetical protein